MEEYIHSNSMAIYFSTYFGMTIFMDIDDGVYYLHGYDLQHPFHGVLMVYQWELI